MTIDPKSGAIDKQNLNLDCYKRRIASSAGWRTRNDSEWNSGGMRRIASSAGWRTRNDSTLYLSE